MKDIFTALAIGATALAGTAYAIARDNKKTHGKQVTYNHYYTCIENTSYTELNSLSYTNTSKKYRKGGK